MPVSESEINKIGYFGYSSICKTVYNSTYSLFVVNDGGEIVGGYDGSAFAVSSDGLLITATHVLDEINSKINESSNRIALTRDTSPFEPQKEIYTDVDIIERFEVAESDISILSIDQDCVSSYEYLSIRADSPLESVGQPVAAFGYPINDMTDGWDISQKTVSGIVSNVDTHASHPAYEIDTLFHPGFSGGPLISLRKGDVIGVVHSRGRYLDEFDSKKFPAPSHLSQANIVTDEKSGNVTIGSKLVDIGVNSQSKC